MEYLKTAAAVLAAVLAGVLPALPAFGGLAELGVTGVANVVVLGAGALGVWATTNRPDARWLKVAVSAASVVGTLIISFYSDGVITNPEWVQLIVGFLGVLGVGGLRNANTENGVFVAGRHAIRLAA